MAKVADEIPTYTKDIDSKDSLLQATSQYLSDKNSESILDDTFYISEKVNDQGPRQTQFDVYGMAGAFIEC